MLLVGWRGCTASLNGSSTVHASLLSMTNAKFQLWRNSIPYARQLMDDLAYDEFSETHLMPSLIQEVCILSSPFPFILFLYFCS